MQISFHLGKYFPFRLSYESRGCKVWIQTPCGKAHFAQFNLHKKQLHRCTVSLFSEFVKIRICWTHKKACCSQQSHYFSLSIFSAQWHQPHLDTKMSSKPSGNKLRDKLVALNGTFSLLLAKNLCLVHDISRGHNLNTADSNKNRKKSQRKMETNETTTTEMRLHNIAPTFYARILSVQPSFTPLKPRNTLMFSEFWHGS